MRKVLFFATIVVSALVIYSCQKLENKSNISDADLATNLIGAVSEVTSTAIAESSSEDIQSVAVEKYDGHSGALLLNGSGSWGMPGNGIGMGLGMGRFSIPHINGCATVTVSSDTFPKEIIISYDSACNKGKHHLKKGKIIINISDTITAEGSVTTIVYKDFYIDSVKVDFSATIKNLGKNTAGNWVIDSKSEQSIAKNGETCVQVKSEQIEWVTGFETSEKTDDSFYKTGAGTISISDSITFSRTITKPLFIDRSCEYILSGTVELMRKGVTTIIDYGDGECDNVATVTTDGTTEEITLDSPGFHEGGKFKKHCKGGFGEKKSGKGGH